MIGMQEVVCGRLRALELTDGPSRLIVVHEVGPRIAWFGRVGGDNLLYWDDTGAHTRGAWRLYGGHRLWLTRPGADESEETYEPDNRPCHVARHDDGVVVTAPATAGGIEKAITIRAQQGAWRIEHRLRNVGAMLWSGGAWPLTCTAPRAATVYRIPLGGGPPAWDVTTIVIPTRWGGGHTSRLDDAQVTLTTDALELRPRRDETKRMVLAPKGVVEMIDPDRGVFRKTARFEPDGRYPLGTNLALYAGPDRFMVEMESMGPQRLLPPGNTLVHVEQWQLDAT